MNPGKLTEEEWGEMAADVVWLVTSHLKDPGEQFAKAFSSTTGKGN